MEKFDLVIAGSGPAGVSAAFKARSLGLSVCLIEKADIGGTCLNRGCIPTKAFLHGAELLRNAREGALYGVSSGTPSFDFFRLAEWKDKVVQTLGKNQSAALVKAGVRIEAGKGRIEEPSLVSVAGGGELRMIAGRAILAAAGTVPARLPIPGNDLDGVYTSDDILDGAGIFSKSNPFPAGVPRRLVIAGGGVIGVELAAAYNAFGSEVTIIEVLPSLLAAMDREIGQNLAVLFKKRGIKVMTGLRIDAIERTAGGLRAALGGKDDAGAASGTEAAVEADAVLMAAGRKPDAASLFAPGVKPELTEKGFAAVDGDMMTSIPGIFAAGDISGGAFCSGLQLAHAAEVQGAYAAARIAAFLSGAPAAASKPAWTIPACVYTTPEIACAGLSLADAGADGIDAIAGKGVFGANGRAALENMERGFIKLVFHAESRALIGAQLFCNRATEIIPWALQCIQSGATAAQIAQTVFPHPSYSETIAQAAKDALQRGGL
jgi:dihydrolipoamide dehydrogenase